VLLLLLALSRQPLDLSQVTSPVVLQRCVGVNAPAFGQTESKATLATLNHALHALGRCSRDRQIRLELRFLDECALQRLAPRYYDWSARWDLGRFDVLAIAAGRKPLLNSASALRFLKADRTTYPMLTIDSNWTNPAGQADFDVNRPSEFFDSEAIAMIRSEVGRGYFVLSRPGTAWAHRRRHP